MWMWDVNYFDLIKSEHLGESSHLCFFYDTEKGTLGKTHKNKKQKQKTKRICQNVTE